MGRIPDNPVSAWKEKVDWFRNSLQCRELDRIDGEPMEFEWKIFPGFNTLQILAETECEPRTDNLHVNVQRQCMVCIENSRIVAGYAKRFAHGH